MELYTSSMTRLFIYVMLLNSGENVDQKKRFEYIVLNEFYSILKLKSYVNVFSI